MCFYTYGKEKTWESSSTDTIYDKHMAVNWRRVNTSILYTVHTTSFSFSYFLFRGRVVASILTSLYSKNVEAFRFKAFHSTLYFLM